MKICLDKSVQYNTIIAATYKLFLEAEKRWKPLRGKNRIAQVINMEKFIDGIHVSEISNDNLNEKNMLSNFFHTQHLTITPLVLNGTVLGAVYISENYKKQLVVEIIKIFAIIKNNKVAYMAKYRVIN